MTGATRNVRDYWHRQLELMWSLPASVVAREEDAVHDLRAAGRRLRSTLRVFEPVLRRSPSAHLVEELSWYNGILGAARDAEVIAEQVGGLADHDELRQRRETLAQLAEQMLVSRRTGRLLDDLDEFIRSPWRGSGGRGSADAPTDAVLLARLDRAEKRVARAWRAVCSGPDDLPAAEHRMRRRAKAARYALEALGGAADGFAARADRYADLTSLLGVMQDVVILQGALAEDRSPAARELLVSRGRRAAQARGDLPGAVWAALPSGLDRQDGVAD